MVPVDDPAPQLLAREPPGVHAQVERVQVVIVALDRAAQCIFEGVAARGSGAHSSISNPSTATSTPASVTSARSGEVGSSTGFVLLRWV